MVAPLALSVGGVVSPELGRWEPLGVADTVAVLGTADFRWWIGGGRALELHLGRAWREHDDTDIGILRRDAPRLAEVLPGWELFVAAGGRVARWDGTALLAGRSQNNVWCRRDVGGPWQLDVTIGEGDDDTWAYRRDPSFRLPWDEAVLHTAAGVPYLAPDLQLLYKSKSCRLKDDVDAAEVIPVLDDVRRERLARRLPADHPWRQWLPPPPGP